MRRATQKNASGQLFKGVKEVTQSSHIRNLIKEQFRLTGFVRCLLHRGLGGHLAAPQRTLTFNRWQTQKTSNPGKNFIFLNGPIPASFSNSFSSFRTVQLLKNLAASGIQTRIVIAVGKIADHYTTTTAR